ncbi:MAG: Yip1 family protein [Ruminococcus sp.]
MMELNERQWVIHTVMHPFEGFDDLRWKKAGSFAYACVIVALWLTGEVLCDNFYGKQFVMPDMYKFSIIPYIVRTVIAFLAWTAGNWAVSTLLDGEGTMKKIFIYSAYALIPYVAQLYIRVFLSHILVRDESVFIVIFEAVGILWTVLLMFMAIKTVHQFSVSGTFLSIILTIAALVVIIALLALAAALVQQVIDFISSVCAEIEYRLRD